MAFNQQLLNEIEVIQSLLGWVRKVPVGGTANFILDMAEIWLAGIEQGILKEEFGNDLKREVQAKRRMSPRLAQRFVAPNVRIAPGRFGAKPKVNRTALWEQFKHEFQPAILQETMVPNPLPNAIDGVVVWRTFRSYVYIRGPFETDYPWRLDPILPKNHDIRPDLPEKSLVVTTADAGWQPPPELQLDEQIWALRTPTQWVIWEPQWASWLKGV